MDYLLSDMQTLMEDIQTNLPNMPSNEVVNLVNSGKYINSLVSPSPSLNYGQPNYKFQDPETKIFEVDFSGSSSIYSPYIYYDKNLSEKFDSVKKTVI